MSEDKTLHPVDVHVGGRIKVLRKGHGMSLQAVGDMIGVSWQQTAKYETGENRVAASRLYDLATALGVPVAKLYEGLPAPSYREDPEERRRREFLNTPEAVMLLDAAMRLPTKVLTALCLTLDTLDEEMIERFKIKAA